MTAVSKSTPIFGKLLESRAMCAGLAGVAGLHLALIRLGWGGWPCPLLHATGIPCPGCGLGRAGVLLLRGEVTQSFQVHAFAGPFLAALLLIGAAVCLPETARRRTIVVVTRIEERLPIVPVLLAALLIYWIARLALDGSHFLAVKAITH